MNQELNFCYGKYANYLALDKRDDDTLYFIEDTEQLFKGNKEYTKGVIVVASSLPTTGQRQGVIYVKKSDLTFWRYTGSAYEQLNKSYATAINSSNAASNNAVPTVKAVVDYLKAKIGEAGKGIYIQDVSYSEADKSIIVDKGNGVTPSYVPLKGLATTPTWDNTQRILTVPIVGADPLVVNFGRDMFVKKGTYNSKTQSIELTLTNDDVVTVPVGALVNIYTGTSSTTATVTVGSDNKIKATVRVSSKEGNQLQATDNGLYVAPSDRYTNDEIDIKFSNAQSALNTHTSDKDIHITPEEREAWNAKVDTTDLAALKDTVLNSAASTAQTKANKALSDAKAYADGLNKTMGGRVTTLENRLTWKQIPEKA